MIFWIASYPKSGNTWLRTLISSYYYSKDGIFHHDLIKNIGQFPEKDYFKDLVEAEKHAAKVAGEPNYPPRPILPEYIAPPVNLLPFL